MAHIISQASALLSNPKTLEGIISQAFKVFDKDHSGYIDGTEVKACVDKVLHLAGIDRPHHTHVDAVFAKVAGPDQRLDQAEFGRLLHMFLDRVHKSPNPLAAH